jgi:hypothetical protein
MPNIPGIPDGADDSLESKYPIPNDKYLRLTIGILSNSLNGIIHDLPSSSFAGVCGELAGKIPLSELVQNAGLLGTAGSLTDDQALRKMAEVIGKIE